MYTSLGLLGFFFRYKNALFYLLFCSVVFKLQNNRKKPQNNSIKNSVWLQVQETLTGFSPRIYKLKKKFAVLTEITCVRLY